MTAPLLVIITGLPGSGKTALARNLSEQFQLPMIHKDGIKETLFNALGWTDEKWSRQLSYTSFQVQYYLLGVMLKAGVSCITEGNFDAELATPEFEHLRSKYPFRPIQVLCYGNGETLWQRFEQRSLSNRRHPGHNSSAPENYKSRILGGRCAPIDLDAPLIELDTTDFEQLDLTSLHAAIASALHR